MDWFQYIFHPKTKNRAYAEKQLRKYLTPGSDIYSEAAKAANFIHDWATLETIPDYAGHLILRVHKKPC